jgi:hypothetical protein
LDCLDLWQPEPVSPGFNRQLQAKIQIVDQKRRVRLWRMSMVAPAVVALCLALWFPNIPGVPAPAEQTLTPGMVNSDGNAARAQAVAQTLADLNMLNQIDSASL